MKSETYNNFNSDGNIFLAFDGANNYYGAHLSLQVKLVDFKLYSEKNSVISKNFGKILSRPHIGLAEISTKSIYSIEIVYNICTVYSIGYTVYHITFT